MTADEFKALVNIKPDQPVLYVEDPSLPPTLLYKLDEKYGHVVFGPLLSSLPATARDLIVSMVAEVLAHDAPFEERTDKLRRYWPLASFDAPPAPRFIDPIYRKAAR